jgi:predicted DNA-binding transcriptional regulator AlpA
MASVEQLVSFRGTARRLDLSIRAVYRLVARGHLPRPVKVGGARKFFESDIAQYLDALKARRS